ncbi:MAG: hypothetical protein IKS41_06585 [Alphaproteobacteria bacterium]|nr:hypothetical protein [Alphaproteobacteria bacterium]
MHKKNEMKDILVLGVLREGLAHRNRDLIEAQKKIAMALLARRNDERAIRQAYRVFVVLEKAITADCLGPTYKYYTSLHQGKTFLEQNAPDLEFGKKYPRASRRLFDYLKSRFSEYRQRS